MSPEQLVREVVSGGTTARLPHHTVLQQLLEGSYHLVVAPPAHGSQ